MSKILGYECVNEEKVNRAIFGSMTSGGVLKGGVGENAIDEVKLAQYDKLGGAILEGTSRVKMGSFWDFQKNCMREKPEVIYTFRDLEGDKVEIPKGEEVPIAVKAAEISRVAKAKKAEKSKKE